MSKSCTVIYSPEAINDLREIYSYIAFELLVPSIAEGQINKIRKAIRSLDFMPLRNSIVDWEPWKSLGMHKVPVNSFIIFYIVNNDAQIVTIIRIVYSGRDIEGIASEIKNK